MNTIKTILVGFSIRESLNPLYTQVLDVFINVRSVIVFPSNFFVLSCLHHDISYKLLKKELLLEKREATTNLRDAREQSRNNMASMTTLRGGVGRFARDYERLRKENELSKHQSQRDQIESQLISVEKRIIWLEKISRS